MKKFEIREYYFWKNQLFGSSLYVSAQLMANVLSTKIAILPILSLSTDAGTIIYPITFTLRDLVHKTLGKVQARNLVLIAGFASLVFSLLIKAATMLPSDPAWGLDSQFNAILTPVWRITFASILSQIVSELLDTEIFSYVYKKLGDLVSVIASNSVSLVVDSVLFTLVAFYGVLERDLLIEIIISNIIIKAIISFVSAPLIKLVKVNKEESKI